MKILFGILLILLLSSCSLKELADNGFKSQSEIDALFETKTLAQKFGDGKRSILKLKIPLTEDSVGYYDLEDILGHAEKNSNKKGWFQRVKDYFKVKIYKIALRFGYSNKLKYSTTFDFSFVDPKYFKDIRVKRVFFTIEDCRPGESACNDRSSKISSNFNFIKRFFVNLEGYKNEGTVGEVESLDAEHFNTEVQKVFGQDESSFRDEGPDHYESTQVDDDQINLLKFSNNVPNMRLERKLFPSDKRAFYLEAKKNKRSVKRYLKSIKFKKYIAGVVLKDDGVMISLADGVKASALYQELLKEQAVLAQKMLIFRIKDDVILTKNFFNDPRLSVYINDLTVIGRSIFVELHHLRDKKKFLELVSAQKSQRDHDILRYDPCKKNTCMDLSITNQSLIDLIVKYPTIKIDTFIELKTFVNSDFKYNGFIEVEVDLDLPI